MNICGFGGFFSLFVHLIYAKSWSSLYLFTDLDIHALTFVRIFFSFGLVNQLKGFVFSTEFRLKICQKLTTSWQLNNIPFSVFNTTKLWLFSQSLCVCSIEKLEWFTDIFITDTDGVIKYYMECYL